MLPNSEFGTRVAPANSPHHEFAETARSTKRVSATTTFRSSGLGCGSVASWAQVMTRTKALLHLARSTSKLSTGELCNFVPSRLLSNSQASTSAASDNSRADGPAGGRRGSRQSDASTRRTAHGGQRDRRPESRGTSRSPTDAPRSSPGSFSAGPSRPTGERRSFNPVNDSEDRSEPEIGFVLDGQYPYAASEVEVVNVAGSTETTWEFLGSVDDQGVTWFGMDFTRGTLPEVERNALLSNEAKEMMYQMHKHDSKR